MNDYVAENSGDIELSVVIPAYKEAAKIQRDIEAAAEFLIRHNIKGEILVVDDGSPDNTVEVAKAMEPYVPMLQVFAYQPNRGKGYALRYGMTRSQGKNVMFADSGLCVPYEIAAIGLIMLNLGMCDVAHGSRRMRGSVRRKQPLYRRIGSKIYGYVIYGLMGVPGYISDTQCGFKIYRGDVARYLYGESFTDGFMFDTEVILRALAQGYQILEFPVLWSNDSDTRYDPIWGTVRNFKELMQIRRGTLGKLGNKRRAGVLAPLPISRLENDQASRGLQVSLKVNQS